MTNIADFWASRAVINYNTGLYDISSKFPKNQTNSIYFITFIKTKHILISDVMGPDEDHRNVNNSIFTNVVAGYSLYLAQ